MIHPDDCAHMDRALMLAERARGQTSPNPMVGAVLVSPDGRVIGSGYHRRAGEPHAEINALSSAMADCVRGATLYCTLEPCCHMGRTGPCVEAIEQAGIRRVVAAVQDPNPLVAGGGFAHLRAHGVEVEVGVRRKAATLLNRAFFTFVRERRPFITLKAATSADGYIAARPGERTALSSAESLRHAHGVRAEVDAIGVGSGTVFVDDPLLTAREVYRSMPLMRVVFDRRLRTPPESRVFSTREHGPVVIVTAPGAPDRFPQRAHRLEAAGARLEPCDGLPAAARRLAEMGITSLLLEGGARLHTSACEADLVDYVQLYIAPGTIGDPGVPLAPRCPISLATLADGSMTACGPDVLVEGYVHRLD